MIAEDLARTGPLSHLHLPAPGPAAGPAAAFLISTWEHCKNAEKLARCAHVLDHGAHGPLRTATLRARATRMGLSIHTLALPKGPKFLAFQGPQNDLAFGWVEKGGTMRLYPATARTEQPLPSLDATQDMARLWEARINGPLVQFLGMGRTPAHAPCVDTAPAWLPDRRHSTHSKAFAHLTDILDEAAHAAVLGFEAGILGPHLPTAMAMLVRFPTSTHTHEGVASTPLQVAIMGNLAASVSGPWQERTLLWHHHPLCQKAAHDIMAHSAFAMPTGIVLPPDEAMLRTKGLQYVPLLGGQNVKITQDVKALAARTAHQKLHTKGRWQSCLLPPTATS